MWICWLRNNIFCLCLWKGYLCLGLYSINLLQTYSASLLCRLPPRCRHPCWECGCRGSLGHHAAGVGIAGSHRCRAPPQTWQAAPPPPPLPWRCRTLWGRTLLVEETNKSIIWNYLPFFWYWCMGWYWTIQWRKFVQRSGRVDRNQLLWFLVWAHTHTHTQAYAQKHTHTHIFVSTHILGCSICLQAISPPSKVCVCVGGGGDVYPYP